MLPFLASALCVLIQATSPPIPIAVTRDGVRVEAVAPQVGDLTLQTPLGSFLTARDPVVEVVDGGPQLAAFERLRADGTLDDAALLRDLSTAGQLTAMTALAEAMQRRDPDALLPYDVLEAWGARVDPVPRKVDRDDRVAWLWKVVQDDDWATAVIAGRRLLDEVSTGSSAANDRILLLSDLRDGLSNRRPWVRRIAARVAGRQQELNLRERIFPMTLEDPILAARDGAAWAANEIHPFGARQYWVRNAARNTDAYRGAAAMNLGRYGGDEGVRALIYILAAGDHRAPERFRYSGRLIWVVKEAKRDAHKLAQPLLLDEESSRYYPVFPERDQEHEFIDLGSMFKVTSYGETVTRALLDALDAYAGRTTGRSAEDWLSWYPAGLKDDTP